MSEALTEREAFGAWYARPRRVRMTGWLAWCASLDQRGVSANDIVFSRPAFDRWLASVRAHDWHEFDAWCAAAWWSRIVTCPPALTPERNQR
jgi:hypothetical protein